MVDNSYCTCHPDTSIYNAPTGPCEVRAISPGPIPGTVPGVPRTGAAGSAAAQPVNPGQNIGTITMNEQNGSSESGSATLSEVNGQLTVMIVLSNGTAAPQPAHIHKGTCANLDPKPLIPLNSVVNGTSQTTVSFTLADFMSG